MMSGRRLIQLLWMVFLVHPAQGFQVSRIASLAETTTRARGGAAQSSIPFSAGTSALAAASTTAPDSLAETDDGTASSSGSSEGGSTEAWTKKRLHNTPIFRSVAVLCALTAAGIFSKSPIALLPKRAAATLHLLSFATWFGTVGYTTFVLGITMFKNLPRQTFGKLQAKLFPLYFSLCSATLVLQLVTLRGLALSAAVKSARALGVALITTLVNQFYLEPKSTENMMKRYELEDEGKMGTEEYKTLKSGFGKLHGMSSLTNLISFCGGVAHAVFMGSALAG